MDGANVLAEYIYNGKGQRAEKWIASENKCTVYHYNQSSLLIAESTSLKVCGVKSLQAVEKLFSS
ncbi:hypothetical protein BMS3Abin10_00185 [bacterium BMS3Abin10]|nr:hypothetical protein BMS3Abin10_00185 [bacterium BMS3Abin10]GBE39817.1 hypothetical protein BMS3Bbin08_02449 [bacterium BMS3Bbin08]